ncbi:MAG: Holliday junction resolvase RecU [Hespellia sp.]|nr:Holliday junction resolvase RecU [Hespellia sp.]
MIGRKSRAAGEMFEKWISDSCDFYYDQNVACIEKTPEPMRPLKPYGDRRMGQYIACFVKQAQPDFKGTLCDGSCIIFDAKHTDHDRIQQNAITETQEQTFDRYEKMGAHCFVVVSIGMENFYRVPWKVWKTMKDRFGHKYMNEEELDPYRVTTKYCKILFLEGVELRDESR